MRFFILLIISLLPFFGLTQSEMELTIYAPRYQVDHSLQLILVQTDLDLLNANITEPSPITLILDQTYEISETINQFKTNRSYQLSANDENWTLYFTNAPIIHLRHEPDTIPNEPKILGEFTYVHHEILKSPMGIEIRGGTATIFPKKSYSFELWTDESGTEKRKEALFGMREDDDWVLLAMYNEALRLRNFWTHQLWQKMHTPYYIDEKPNAEAGADFKYVEVFLNEKYQGLYLLGEPIDRKQLKLDHFEEEAWSELYKGKYWHGILAFNQVGDFWNGSRQWGGFELKYPSHKDTIRWNFLYDFVEFVVNAEEDVFHNNIENIIELDNFVDFYLLLTMMRGWDNTSKNTYLAKHKQGEKYFYVPWDFDGVWGKNYRGESVASTEGYPTNGLLTRLITANDCNPFIDRLKNRWDTLQNSHFNINNIHQQIDSIYATLLDHKHYERENLLWDSIFNPTLAERNFMKDWIAERFQKVDQHINQLVSPDTSNCDFISNLEEEIWASSIQVFPNPSRGPVSISTTHTEAIFFKIFNLQGQLLSKGQLKKETRLIDLPNGIAIIHFQSQDGHKNDALKIFIE